MVAFANVVFHVKRTLYDGGELGVLFLHLVLEQEPNEPLFDGLLVVGIALGNDARVEPCITLVAQVRVRGLGPIAHGRQPLVQVAAAARATSEDALRVDGEQLRRSSYCDRVRLDVVGQRVHLEGNGPVGRTQFHTKSDVCYLITFALHGWGNHFFPLTVSRMDAHLMWGDTNIVAHFALACQIDHRINK